ncbi:FtsK/SpoIIIE domain-containing protein [Kitasatospora sp. NBC_01287]|uniref:FtsK/SpoIIIE domain-containing protein n=1 Tax=Kitasatospora sp. NBC_01287 TaxID=2903573 RepID=UPI00225AAA2A|nr:FtsK/SpoIIIE domain-containing protein [Kitasatospora sp. NBC_01287]MCX4748723.1 FtsK/SpoIIIE domain-containing protein [Kitasatospora sp. NBC_01287]
MQIRLTVLRPRAGAGVPAPATDVLVTAPVGTALGSLAVALAGAVGVRGARSATHVHLYAGARRIDERTPLGHPPLLNGAVLTLGEPDPDAAVPPDDGAAAAAVELRVVGGPDAGGVHRLHGSQVRVGRSSEADVPLDDPDVSRLHLSLQLAADGGVTVHDLGSTNGTSLDGRPLAEEPRPLPEGALLRLGESTVALAAAPAADQVRSTAPDGLGHLQVSPAPRPSRPGAPAAEPPAPPAAAGSGRTRSLLSRTLGRSPTPAAAPDTAQQHARARDRQAAARRERFPDPAGLLLSALGPGPRLWERLPAHPDALVVRLGTADVPAGPGTTPGAVLPAVPVTVDLRAVGSLGLTGPRERLLGLSRSLLAQLAVLHPPSGLSLVVVSADEEHEAEQRTADWGWSLWLPHLRPGQGQDCRLLVGLDQAQAQVRLAELADRPAEAGAQPLTVLLVDGDPGSEPARQALARLLRQGAAAGVFTICLAERPALLPRGLGADAAVTGEVATRLTVGIEGRAAEEVVLDAVSAAWAERLARALAPLREAAPVSRGPLPEALRLLDLLELDTVTPAKLSARWADLPSTAGTATALLGTTRDDLCTIDLAGAGLGEPQHLLVGGARGAGKSELLRTLVASLAVGERPDRLQVLLIGGRDDALAGCAELPHVTGRVEAAAEPRQALLTAEALQEELARREELFRDRSFPVWFAERALTARPAVIGPQRSAEQGARRPASASASTATATATATATVAGTATVVADALPARLVVVVDDYDALLAPTSPAGRPLARALGAVAQRGGRLGMHLVAATGRPELSAGSELDEAALWRIALRTDHPADSELLVHVDDAAALPEQTPGRGYLRRPDGAVLAFQTARVSGRIPRTATLRPTVVALDPAQLGAPPTRRPVRELGNGPTDLALLASALQRAAQG